MESIEISGLELFGISNSRSSRYRLLKRLIEQGALYKVDGGYRVNVFSPVVWRRLYRCRGIEYTVYRALSLCGGVVTGVRVAGINCPNPYSSLDVYEVYVPLERADLFSAIIGLNEDLLVYPDTSVLYRTGFMKPVVIAYPLVKGIDYTVVDTVYGFQVGEAYLEQAFVDVVRGDFWFYTGIAFEIYYYIRRYIDPDKLLEIASRLGVEDRVYTVEFIVSNFIGKPSLFNIDPDKLVNVNMFEILGRLSDVLD